MARPDRPFVTHPNGTKVYLDELPLVAFRLTCGHVGKDYAVQQGDVYFCEVCKDNVRVAAIVSA